MVKTIVFEDSGTLFIGDSLETLKTLRENSVDSCITSPPYWGLRDYGCEDQIGQEKTPEEYVNKLVAVFHEVKRVMKPDGVLWLNLGDSYAGSNCGSGDKRESGSSLSKNDLKYKGQRPGLPPGLKPKDLVGIPWRVAFALQADGWYLRQDIIWSKPNPMPESVKDRCTKAHEYIFMLTKSARYYFDHEAIKEPTSEATKQRAKRAVSTNHKWLKGADGQTEHTMSIPRPPDPTRECNSTRNKRSVWDIAAKGFKGAHFATYSPQLIAPCILASKPDAVILDPFFGSGTTGIAAMAHGRTFTGIEINPEYANMAAQRIYHAMIQTDIEDKINGN